jgi:8-hydroxy-5-deazaflavin:NADPH oxidoreductase
MKIGFIGASTVAQTIAKHVLPFGHQVMLSNSRGPDSLADVVKELGAGATAGTPQQVAEQVIVVLAARWSNVQSALFAVPEWKGRILVDATNRVASYTPLALGDISGRTSSEIVADLAGGARVVKAFNSVPMSWISDFSPTKPRTVLFISGDDADAKKPVNDLIEEVGFSCVDLGSLAVGGRLQQLGGPLAAVRLTFSERFVL